MSAARLNSRALTVRGTLPQIGSFSLAWISHSFRRSWLSATLRILSITSGAGAVTNRKAKKQTVSFRSRTDFL